MELIEHFEVDATPDVGITFSSIPATFTDLYLVVSGKTSRTNSPRDNIKVQFNGVTSGYSYKLLEGTGSAAGSSGASSQAQIVITNALSTNMSGLDDLFGSTAIYIPNYLSSNEKSVSSEQTSIRNSTDSHSAIQASLSTITSPITSIYLSPENGDFVQYSSASLFGIKSLDT